MKRSEGEDVELLMKRQKRGEAAEAAVLNIRREQSTTSEIHPRRVVYGPECPYLDTINRQFLDFDFEKCCSVSLRQDNVYVCLVCGKYFQGRGRSTHAFTHALEDDHQMFMKLDNGAVYCLPDNYEVIDHSLDDIRHVLNPLFTKAEVTQLDTEVTWARSLDGTEYMPGLVGLNNMKSNDYVNVILQALNRVTPIRDFFLIPRNYRSCSSEIVARFGELLRKMWNTKNFKGQVSPHEFMQAVMKASAKRFTIEQAADPIEFCIWLINRLHHDLTKGHPKRKSVITRCFQGQLKVTTFRRHRQEDKEVPFLFLGLDLPPPPLFKDPLEKNIIPQVPIYTILRKFDGQTIHDDIKSGRRQFKILKLPEFLILHIKRFTKNNFFVEKNPTIVNFPIRNLDLSVVLGEPEVNVSYDLICNICHDGQAVGGSYRCHIERKVERIWYEVQDLRVTEVLPQIVNLSETYMQVYQLRNSDEKTPQQVE